MLPILKTPRDDIISVGSTSVELSPETNTQRNVIVITNTSTAGQLITLAFAKEAINGKGIVLFPTGAWAESIDSAFRPSNARITAVADGAGGQVTIHERVE
jgi:hypothetical protein